MHRTVAVIVVALIVVPAAEAKVYDVPASLGAQVAKVAKRTPVAVRLPASLDLDFDGRLYASGTGSKQGYSLGLDGARPCGANVCSLASFDAERGGTPAFRRTARLARGITGYYKPLTCGGSCSPPMIQWLQGGVLYSIQAKIGTAGNGAQRMALVRAANESIRATPR